jgi:DNA-binding HxlR family transcriptional regulator
MCEVLFCIEEGNSRFKTIKESLIYISDTILADRLKMLEKYHLIYRAHFEETPPRVEYTITEKGIELSNLLDKICQFSETIVVEKNAALSSIEA